MAQFNYQKAAIILAEADYQDEQLIAAKWGISTKTIAKYRTRLLEGDKTLQSLYYEAHTAQQNRWQSKSKECLLQAIYKLEDYIKFTEFNDRNIQNLLSVTGVLGALSADVSYEIVHGDNSEENGGSTKIC